MLAKIFDEAFFFFKKKKDSIFCNQVEKLKITKKKSNHPFTNTNNNLLLGDVE